MNKIQLTHHLTLLHKDLFKVSVRCNKISKALNIESNMNIEIALSEVATLLEMIKGETV